MKTKRIKPETVSSVSVRQHGRLRRHTFYFNGRNDDTATAHPVNFYGSPVLYGWIKTTSTSPAVINGCLFGWLRVADNAFTPLGVISATPAQRANGNETGSPSIDESKMDARGLAYLLITRRVRSDMNVNSFMCQKPIESDDTLTGLTVRFNGFMHTGDLTGFVGKLTGRSCFAYAGAGHVYETVSDVDGSIAWLNATDFAAGEPTRLEARRAALYAQTDSRRFCSVRKPTSVRMGFRAEGDCTSYELSAPLSVTDYASHSATLHANELRRRMRSIRRAVAQHWREYRQALRKPSNGNGGSGHGAPFYVEHDRIGWTLYSDPSRKAVRAFDSI